MRVVQLAGLTIQPVALDKALIAAFMPMRGIFSEDFEPEGGLGAYPLRMTFGAMHHLWKVARLLRFDFAATFDGLAISAAAAMELTPNATNENHRAVATNGKWSGSQDQSVGANMRIIECTMTMCQGTFGTPEGVAYYLKAGDKSAIPRLQFDLSVLWDEGADIRGNLSTGTPPPDPGTNYSEHTCEFRGEPLGIWWNGDVHLDAGTLDLSIDHFLDGDGFWPYERAEGGGAIYDRDTGERIAPPWPPYV